MAILENLEPKSVFYFFEEISKIPHGSGNTKQISDFIVNFAKKRNLEYYQDELNNVIIIKPATDGYENSEPVILQGHIDMVCQQTDTCTKDMSTDGLDLIIDGDIISATGTTLGADDGIAVAMTLAVLDSNEISHPRIEAVFTVDEETGMFGAIGIDTSPLKAKKMINMDSEVDDKFIVGCAGGILAQCTLPIKREDYDGTAVSIDIYNLKGGHSGDDIHRGRTNANILLGRILYEISKNTELRICSLNGGEKHNVIPNNAHAVAIVKDFEITSQSIAKVQDELSDEYASADPNIKIDFKATDYIKPFDKQSTDKTIFMLMNIPNGVQEMSFDIKDLVQTSLSLGILNTDINTVSALSSIRSSIDSQKYFVADKLKCFMDTIGGNIEFSGCYPGWQYRKNSPLRDIMVDVFKELRGFNPTIVAIHAGVECGIFAEKIEDFDCVSIGPNIHDIHTVNEAMEISSVQRTWDFLLEILKRLK